MSAAWHKKLLMHDTAARVFGVTDNDATGFRDGFADNNGSAHGRDSFQNPKKKFK